MGVAVRLRQDGIVHEIELSLTSDFSQSIVEIKGCLRLNQKAKNNPH